MEDGSTLIYQRISSSIIKSSGDLISILAKGMNSSELACILAKQEQQTDSSKLTFIVTTGKQDLHMITENFKNCAINFFDHTIEYPRDTRRAHYRTGGIFVVNHNVFVLDLMEDFVDPLRLNMVIMENIFYIMEYHPMAMAISMLKRVNPALRFICLLNDPQRASANARFLGLMKNMCIPNCQLWPIHHEDINGIFVLDSAADYNSLQDKTGCFADFENDEKILDQFEEYNRQTLKKLGLDDSGYPITLPPGQGRPKLEQPIPRALVSKSKANPNLVFQEIFIPEEGPVLSHQNKLINIMRCVYKQLAREYREALDENIQFTFQDVVEIPCLQFDMKQAHPQRFKRNRLGDMLEDLHSLRTILSAFNSPLKTRVLVNIISYTASVYNQRKFYDGFYKEDNPIFPMFNEFILDVEKEMYEVIDTPMSPEMQNNMMGYIRSPRFGLEDYPYSDFKSSFILNTERKSKMSFLLKMLREIGDSRTAGSTSQGKNGKTENCKVLILCGMNRKEELNYLISSYFNCSGSEHNLIELHHLQQYLLSRFKRQERLFIFKNPTKVSRISLEKAVFEERLSSEIYTLVDIGKQLIKSQVVDNYEDDFIGAKPFVSSSDNGNSAPDDGYGEEDENLEGGDNFSDSDAEEKPGQGSGKFAVGKEQNNSLLIGVEDPTADLQRDNSCWTEAQRQKNDKEIAGILHAQCKNLWLIPLETTRDSLRMYNLDSYDESGLFKMKSIPHPGVDVRVVDHEQYNIYMYSVHKNFKADKIIIFDQSTHIVRRLQIYSAFANSIELTVFIGSSYLEGWLYRVKDSRENRVFRDIGSQLSKLSSLEITDLTSRLNQQQFKEKELESKPSEKAFKELLGMSGKSGVYIDEEYLSKNEDWIQAQEEELQRQQDYDTFGLIEKESRGPRRLTKKQLERLQFDEEDKGLVKLSGLNETGQMVIVDKREFNSEVPGVLYFHGFKIKPMYVKSGDYIVSNTCALERKGYLDFQRTLRSTKQRFEKQLEAMQKNFPVMPVLQMELYSSQRQGLREMNNWCARSAEYSAVYRNTPMVAPIRQLNYALVLTMVALQFPSIVFMYSFSSADTVLYIRHLKHKYPVVSPDPYVPYNKKFESIAGVLNTKKKRRQADYDEQLRSQQFEI